MKLLQLSDGSQAIVTNDPSSFEELVLEKLGLDAANHFHSLCYADATSIDDLTEEINRLECDLANMYEEDNEDLEDFRFQVECGIEAISSELSKLRDYMRTL